MAVVVNESICVNGVQKLSMSDPPVEKKAKIQTEVEKFDAMFLVLVNYLEKEWIKDNDITETLAWFRRVSEYNVPFGKKNRGMSVVHTYKILNPEATEEELDLARVLGWCVEWLQAYFLVADDIMDNSITRRGQPCWYRRNEVRMIAVNDGYYLENAIYVILKKYFRGKPCYVDLLQQFHDSSMATIIGQNLDMTTAPTDRVDFSGYTLDRYKTIVHWKTANYSFYLPVACAMYLAGIQDEETHRNANTILSAMGEFFQIQDDFLDCYGDPEVIGKVGRDIEDNKCSWLVVQALQRASAQQKQILQDNYASEDPEKVAKVKAVFKDLALEKVYEETEEESYANLLQLIEKLSGDMPKEAFILFANKIYKRKK